MNDYDFRVLTLHCMVHHDQLVLNYYCLFINYLFNDTDNNYKPETLNG
jgi:hypothetical protein